MQRRISPALVLAAVGCLAAGAVAVGVGGKSQPPPGAHAGPKGDFTTEIMHGNVVPLKNQAMITKTSRGYIYRGGQQDNHLVVTRVSNGLRFVDTHTDSFRKLSRSCKRQKVSVGVAAVCRVPAGVSARKPLLIEVWPRLGDDLVDTTDLSGTVDTTVLGDKGNDTALFGDGRDYFNGYSGRDVISGGAGNDWLRPGLGNDKVQSGSGNDDVVAVEGKDKVSGGSGKDRLWGGDGNDQLSGGDGQDFVMCGVGQDDANVDSDDDVLPDCESLSH